MFTQPKSDEKTGIITTVAGDGQPNFAGDNGPATAASLFEPGAVILDAAGNLIIADLANNRVRKVDAKTGVITTIAGSGASSGSLGDGGPATSARLAAPNGLAFDAAQNLYIADKDNRRIRRVNAQTGIITTVAGPGGGGFKGDGGPALSAAFTPGALAFDSSGNLYVTDGPNHRIRAIRGPIP